LVKVKEPGAWRYVHRLVWEEHNGPVPKGYIVTFLDGNKENTDISNLALISQRENLLLIQNGLRNTDAELTKCGIAIARSITAVRDAKKRRNRDEC